MFPECPISILEWFKKDHVTLESEVMAAENSFLPLFQIIIIIFGNITVFTVFVINAALLCIRDFFLKKKIPNFLTWP